MTLTGGERIGRIDDVILHAATGRITGFLIGAGGLFSKAGFLPAGQVQTLGTDALTVPTAEALQDHSPAQTDPAEIAAKSLEGRPVLTESGTVLGKVAGILVDDQTLMVSALSLSTGIMDNALHGKPHLPWSTIKTLGEHSVIVPASYDPKDAAAHASLG